MFGSHLKSWVEDAHYLRIYQKYLPLHYLDDHYLVLLSHLVSY